MKNDISRRSLVSKGATLSLGLAGASLLPGIALGQSLPQNDSTKTAGGRYRPPFRFGLGGAPIGGSSGLAVTDDIAEEILENAWEEQVRLYDTSPWYGLGLSERRFGELLHNKPRQEFVLSTKVGRILTATDSPPKTGWANPDSFAYTYDYSAAAARRSVEDSLQRLGVGSLDIVYIHDLSPDNGDIKDDWMSYMEQAAKGAMPELTKMREEGLIKAWGLGVNTLPPILEALERADPDIFLAACQYSLADHSPSVEKLFPACDARGVSIMVGSPLNNGFLAGRDRFNYGKKIPAGMLEKRAALTAVAADYEVDLRTAALQFAAAPSTVSCIIPGARQPQQIVENVASMSVAIPSEFWQTLKTKGLIDESAPVPT